MSYEGIPGLHVDVSDGVATVTIDSPPINLFTLELFLHTAQLAERRSTDLDAGVFPGNPDEDARTRALLRQFV